MSRHETATGTDAALVTALRRGERAAVARALNVLDGVGPRSEASGCALLAALGHEPLASRGHMIGITGPPGVGKSTVIAALVRAWGERGHSVGVLAVDPSSAFSGGAFLGDRFRIAPTALDESVFVRSLASRGMSGGLSSAIWPMGLVMLTAFDRVVVETVGIGQNEIDVATVADTTCFVVQPASGDSVQCLKAGIMEVPDVLVINKADLGDEALRAKHDVEASLMQHQSADTWCQPVLLASAIRGVGVTQIVNAFDRHRVWSESREDILAQRRRRAATWVLRRLLEEYGRFGIATLGGASALLDEIVASTGTFFEQLDQFGLRIKQSFTGPA